MATVPVPHTWVAGTDHTTEPNLRTLTDSALYNLGSATSTGARKALAVLNQTVAQTFGTSGTAAAITFTGTDTVDYDNGHSTVTNTTRYTAPTPGWYDVCGVIAWASNASGFRWSYLAVNGTPVLGSANVVAGTGAVCVPTPLMPVYLNGSTDYVELWGRQTSGGSLDTLVAGTYGEQSRLSVEWRSN